MTAIRANAVSKTFGDVAALDGLSLSVEEGELYGLLGPNGAGKTTTIELLTGQTIPDCGTLRVLEIDPVDDPMGVRGRVGILPEKESPPSLMTPREYVHFCGTVRDTPEHRVEAGLGRWSLRLGCTDILDTLSTDLSRGQQQKVMIIAAFLHEPAVVFIDEPLANLDPIVQETLKRFLRSYVDEGNTILLSTHNVDVAAELCDRVGILHGGTIVDELRPATLTPERTLLDAFLDRVGQEVHGDTHSHA